MNVVTHMKPSNKKAIRKHIDDIIGIRTEELEIFRRNITQPLRDIIKMMNEAKQGRIPLEVMMQRSEGVSKHIQDFLAEKPNGFLCIRNSGRISSDAKPNHKEGAE